MLPEPYNTILLITIGIFLILSMFVLPLIAAFMNEPDYASLDDAEGRLEDAQGMMDEAEDILSEAKETAKGNLEDAKNTLKEAGDALEEIPAEERNGSCHKILQGIHDALERIKDLEQELEEE